MSYVRNIQLNSEVLKIADSRVDLLVNKKIVIIGDSYGLGWSQSGTIYTPYPTWIKNFLNIPVYNVSESGSGFVNFGDEGHRFTELLDTLDSTVDKTLITDVIVAGGYNDRTYQPNIVLNGITSFVTKSKELYPNAKITVAFIGWCTNSQDYEELDATKRAYKVCTIVGACYMDGIDKVMHNMSYFDSDGIHPNEVGHQVLGEGMTNYLLGSECSSADYVRTSVELNTVNGISVEGTLYQSMNDNIVNWGWYDLFNIGSLSIYGSQVLNGGTRLTIGNFVSTSGYARGYWGMKVTVPCTIGIDDGTVHMGYVTINVVNGELAILLFSCENGAFVTGTISYVSIMPNNFTINNNVN